MVGLVVGLVVVWCGVVVGRVVGWWGWCSCGGVVSSAGIVMVMVGVSWWWGCGCGLWW